MDTKSSSHGGARAGAGRKPRYSKVELTPSVIEDMEVVKNAFPHCKLEDNDDTLRFCLAWVARQERETIVEKGVESYK